ncbi:MAG TPA: tetratricopeptide repeat protein [Candidatus Binataceae bacterium]
MIGFVPAAIAGAPPMAAARAIDQAQASHIVVAHLEEESIPAAEMPSPTATPTPAAGAEGEPPAESPGAAYETAPPGAVETPAQNPGSVPTTAAQGFPEPTPQPTPAGEIVPLEIGSITPTANLSESSLQPLINSAATPALATSLRITEEARLEISTGNPDDAIRDLGRAVSIDPSAGYAYFYLARAYLLKKDYQQAMTFFKRAESGFGANRPWLSETLAFEGLIYEQTDRALAAEALYQQALVANPGNLTARVGYTRLSSTRQATEEQNSPTAPDAPAPKIVAPEPAPNEPPPPPPPPPSD